METTPDKIETLLEIARHPVSLETPIDEEGDSTFGDFVEDVSSPAPTEEVATHLLHEQLEKALGRLPAREAQILKLRYGLEDGRVYTLEEVGQTIGVTRERVRQLEAQALNRLRQLSGTCHSPGLSVRGVGCACKRITRALALAFASDRFWDCPAP